MKYHFTKTWLFLILIVASCSSATAINHDLYTESSGLKINCNIGKIEIRNIKKDEIKIFNLKSNKLSYLHGTIILYNANDIKIKYNLKNYYLKSGNKKSSELYIDSNIDYIITDKVLGPNERITKSVYWVFDGIIDNEDIRNLQLIIHK